MLPSEVIISISIIMLFSNINIKNKYILKIIFFFAPLTYGTYLIHNHPLVRVHIIGKYFSWLINLKLYNLLIIEILCSFTIFLICSLIDFIRLSIFKMLRIKQIINSILNFYIKIVDKVCLFDIL